MRFTLQDLSDGKKQLIDQQPFNFIQGGSIAPLVQVYETYGQLNKDKSNAVLVHHALSTNSHVKSHDKNTAPGWWEEMIGPGCPIDTNKFFVICINNIGSCFGSSNPTSINPESNEAYQASFPQLLIEDITHAQAILIEYLGIKKLYAVIGPSMGAMISLAWAILYPEQVPRLISISSSYKSYPTNCAVRSLQREILQLDPAWNGGFYGNNKLRGFTIARKLAHLTYRNAEELNHRFNIQRDKHNIHTYLDYNANKFTANFDANSYCRLTAAMDEFDVSLYDADPIQPFKQIEAKCLIISVSSDKLFEPFQQYELAEALLKAHVDTSYIYYTSDYGHDAFLVEIEGMGNLITQFLNS